MRTAVLSSVTYRHDAEDVNLCGVKLLGFVVCWNRYWYEFEVLGEEDDQHSGPACMTDVFSTNAILCRERCFVLWLPT